MKTQWAFKFQGRSAQTIALDIYDTIGADPFFGGGVAAKSVLAALDEHPNAEVLCRINSAGGIVTEGLAIYNLLKQRKAAVTCRVDSLAGSIASIIAMAGNLEMAEHSYLMIHNPWGWIEGDATELRHQADVLDSMRGEMVSIYAAKCGKSREFIESLMAKETWLTATEALAHGFCNKIIADDSGAKLAAHLDLSQFRNTPREFAAVSHGEDIQAAVRTVLNELGIKTDSDKEDETIVAAIEPVAVEQTDNAAKAAAQEEKPKMDEEQYKAKIAELEAALADAKAKLSTESEARAKAEADAAEAKAKFTKKGDDDEDDDDEEMAALKSVVSACIELTGEKDLTRLEGAVMALGPKLDGAANAKAAREIQVSGLIAKGKLLPAQKKWALNCKPEALAAYIESIGNAKVGPVGEEHIPGEDDEKVRAARAAAAPPAFDPESVQLDASERAVVKQMALEDPKLAERLLSEKREAAKAEHHKKFGGRTAA